ncbi:putative peroxisomal membrane protein receptor Pex19 [Aspergillus clavatus NRRL 1]|uniref:Peroxisomal membrane protein receptor Pex19, putative n=1 Tax=Aspergillus clavatus (strain ATCC 1007 / CBS 513.65 / DSM 816 / NCTC 3887 / NRRL 1 / QM 1276 / 107) TaxID=344612 RepID=A1CKJ7_ASPCL|nr:peroxisomal membrane protein receptor Pex19, putative [Aspergillus clavatus NRRL 1]EAW09671.1 peroxisomal membrane protein receptor Pex19, putative [Aspergillus clavatus NRRL 1]
MDPASTPGVTNTTPRPEESPSAPAAIPQPTPEPAPTTSSNVNEPSAPAETPSATDDAPAALSASVPAQKQNPASTVQDDSDSDSEFDELDGHESKETNKTPDVLDNFSKPAAQPAAPADDFDDDAAFMRQLEQDMAKMMGHAAQESGAANDKEFENTINQGADAFTKQLEESGIPPGDFLKQLLADVMAEEEEGTGAGAGAAASAATASVSASAPAGASAGAGAGAAPESFNDAIQRTIHRMKESGDKATAAATEEGGLSEDVLMQLLKSLEDGAGAGDDDLGFTKMIAGMMEQFTNKEMLYEPMKELDGKWGPWLKENRGKVADEDMERYEKQAKLVTQIVEKFEEEGYTDEDPKHRGYVWERMQEMQALGSPPEELVANPWPEDMGELGDGNANVPGCPQQ